MRKIPLLVFLLLVAALAAGLIRGKDPAQIGSAMVGRAMPETRLPPATASVKGFSTAGLRGSPVIINFFASWCLPCREEQAVLEEISKAERISVYGISYKDKPEKLAVWLKKNGNPYRAIGADPSGRAAIDWGVYGVPETFIVDRTGTIRYKHTGPVTPEAYRAVLRPLLAELRK